MLENIWTNLMEKLILLVLILKILEKSLEYPGTI